MTTAIVLAILIFVAAYILIASEKLDKAVVALLGAGVMVACKVADFQFMLTKVDLNVIGLLIGMMIIVGIMATTGAFEFLAVTIARQTRGNGVLAVCEFLLATAFISAFMDNVTTVILMAPVTILICQFLSLPVVPVLILEALFSNIGGTATLIGDPPNILIGASCGLSFNDFLINLTPVIVVVTVVCLVFAILPLRRKLRTEAAAVSRVMQTEPARAILDPVRLKRAMVVFALVLLGFFTGRLTGLEPGLIALCGALLMTLVCKVKLSDMLEKVEWSTILFFCGLFMMVGGLEANGIFDTLGRGLLEVTGGNFALTLMVILGSTAILSAIVDNIPLVIAMIPLIFGIIPSFIKAKYPEIDLTAADLKVLMTPDVYSAWLAGGSQAVAAKFAHPEVLQLLTPALWTEISKTVVQPLLWSLALGACLGGNGTLVGASANVVIAQIAHRNHYSLDFRRFTMWGFPIMILSVIISGIWLYLRYIA